MKLIMYIYKIHIINQTNKNLHCSAAMLLTVKLKMQQVVLGTHDNCK